MKAIIQETYGGVETLKMVEVNKPIINDNQVLVKVKTANVASGDMRINTLNVPFALKFIMKLIFGFKGPRNQIRGISASGIIEETGSKVTTYKKGDKVYFINSMKAGCLAEYVALKETSVMAHIPSNTSFDEAAPIAFGAMSAYHFINGSNIKQGDKVLIYGASGSVGIAGLQLAINYGASVTAVSSKKNHQVLLDLGADHVIDYHEHDFRSLQKKYDVIFDAVGKISKRSSKKVLENNGKYLTVKMPTKEATSRLLELNKIIETGKLVTVIDKVYQFDAFKEAHEHVYNGHKVGNVIIKIG